MEKSSARDPTLSTLGEKFTPCTLEEEQRVKPSTTRRSSSRSRSPRDRSLSTNRSRSRSPSVNTHRLAKLSLFRELYIDESGNLQCFDGLDDDTTWRPPSRQACVIRCYVDFKEGRQVAVFFFKMTYIAFDSTYCFFFRMKRPSAI